MAAANKESREKHRVVVVGGGTGTYTVLRGLKAHHDELDLTAVVTMADSGGSTGRLRDEFGQLPVGDVRMALAALSADLDRHGELVRELFLYRFAKGDGLSGHNFGNLLLTALTDMLGNEARAIEAAAQILRVRGRVLPVTADHTHLVALYDDGVVCTGEKDIDAPPKERWPHRITSVSLEPRAVLTPQARAAIQTADSILFGPGDLFTSILATVAADGFTQALAESAAQTYFVCNLMTKAGQTTGMSASEHVAVLEQATGRPINAVILNDEALPRDLLSRYAAESEYPVCDDLTQTDRSVIRTNILAQEVIKKKDGDAVKRSLIRHDPDRLASLLYRLWLSDTQK